MSFLDMAQVSYTYPGWPAVVDRVDWRIAQGEFHCLVGRSGCGKTTLLKLAAGLLRLGHDVRYVETTSAWPYDAAQGSRVDDASYTLAYLARITPRFGLGERWAYRRSWGDGAWLGPAAAAGQDELYPS